MNYLPPALSFLLPGLGQVYQRRPIPALIAFTLFTTTHFVSWGAWFSPVIAILAATEAFRFARDRGATEAKPESRRVAVYCVTGMLGFMAWMSLISTSWLPMSALMETSEKADSLAVLVRKCAKKLGQYPKQLPDCGDSELTVARDPWGSEFSYELTERGFLLRSIGRDLRSGTEDDYVYRFR